MYDSSPRSPLRFCSRLAFHSEILPYSGSARPRLLGEFVRTKDINRRIAAAVAWGEGNWGNFWFCLIVTLVGVDGSNVSLSLPLLLSWNSRGGNGGYNAIQRSCLMCNLGSKVGMIIPYSNCWYEKGAHSEGLNCGDRSCSSTDIPDSYCPSSKQVSTRPSWCRLISRSWSPSSAKDGVAKDTAIDLFYDEVSLTLIITKRENESVPVTWFWQRSAITIFSLSRQRNGDFIWINLLI